MGLLQTLRRLASGGTAKIDVAGAADGSVYVAAVGRRIGEPVTVSVASLAASAVAYCPGTGWIDLGEDWSPATLVVCARLLGVGSANERMTLECTDDTSTGAIYSGAPALTPGLASTNLVLAASGSDVIAQFRAISRYVRLRYTNGSTQQSGSAVLRIACGAPV